MSQYLPLSLEDAFGAFEEERPEAPADCHHHCTHFETDGECCDCGEQRPVPVKEFLHAQPAARPYFDFEEGWGI